MSLPTHVRRFVPKSLVAGYGASQTHGLIQCHALENSGIEEISIICHRSDTGNKKQSPAFSILGWSLPQFDRAHHIVSKHSA